MLASVSVSMLERDVFAEAAAARLLGVPQNTLHHWLEGGTVGGRAYKPVIRVEPRGGRPPVTWAEFVGAGLLREYRQGKRVPMAELRAFIDRLRLGRAVRTRRRGGSRAARPQCPRRRPQRQARPLRADRGDPRRRGGTVALAVEAHRVVASSP
jgi:hypothetical protein